MSDDYADTANDHAPSGDDPEPGFVGPRIAIRARSEDTAGEFWQAIEKRFRKKSKFIPQRAHAIEADVCVCLLTGEDFADDTTVDALLEEISAIAAPLNILIEPKPVGDPEINRRLVTTLADLATRSGYVCIAVNPEAEANQVSHQAKAVFRLLQTGREAADSVAMVEKDPSSAQEGKVDRAERRAQRRAAKNVRKKGRDIAAASPGASEALLAEKGGRAEKKARKRAAKEGKRAESGKTTEKRARESTKEPAGAEAVPADAVTAESRATKRAERKARKDLVGKKDIASGKAKRGGGGATSDAGAAVASTEDGTRNDGSAKQKKPKKSKNARSGSEPVTRALFLSITGLKDDLKAALRESLERTVLETGAAVRLVFGGKKTDIAIYAFDEPRLAANEITQQAEVIAGINARVRIFLERAIPSNDSIGEENRAIARLAGTCGGSFVRLGCKFRRYGDGAMIADGQFTQAGWNLLAASILGIMAARLPKLGIIRPQPPAPPDLMEARALAAAPPELLAQLLWSKTSVPKLLWASASKAAMEPLIDERLSLSAAQTVDLRAPVMWPEDTSSPTSRAQILGLEFLISPLFYWYSKASGRNDRHVADIDELLKERQIKASEILARAEKLMVDFMVRYPSGSAPSAWQEDGVSRRARVFVLYLLCCKMALKRRIRFDAETFATVCAGLFDLIELLRADDLYRPVDFDGCEQDFLLIGLGLALRGTAYGNRVLDESLERFRTLQLDPGLTADGVWRGGSFSEHCALLSGIRSVVGHFDNSDGALIEPFAAAAKKMTVFAEAMLKSNGMPPAIDKSKQKSYLAHLSSARIALAQAGGKSVTKSQVAAMPRITETYVFRDAQYFISHSTQKVSDDSSLVALHADSPSLLDRDPGGVTLVFAHGPDDLLVRSPPAELADKKDKSPLFDPALRNGYHVDGAGFMPGGAIKQNAARIVKSWRGPGWAAAKSIDEINAAASVSRVVTHLKIFHALIVIDELQSAGGAERLFEQFWHIASGLAVPPLPLQLPLRFELAQAGGMTVAFDAQGAISIDAEGEGSCVRRSVRLTNGLVASLFQWSEAPAPAAIEIVGREPGGWVVSVSGASFKRRLILRGDEFVCEEASGS